MTPPSITMTTNGHVAHVLVSNPSLRNALTREMALQLLAVCDRLEHEDGIGAVVISGDAGSFCSGADTGSWADTYSTAMSDEAYLTTDEMYGSFFRFGQLPMPTICALRGAAVGAGLNLTLAADLRIVADDARILAGFLKAGIHPGGGFFTIASRVAGREAAAGLGLFSEEINGPRAVQVGLAWESVPDEKVEDRAFELAHRIAADPVLARRVVKSFRAEADPSPLSWSSAIELERGVQMWTQHRRLAALDQEVSG